MKFDGSMTPAGIDLSLGHGLKARSNVVPLSSAGYAALPLRRGGARSTRRTISMQATRAPRRARALNRSGSADTLTHDERTAIDQGRLFKQLPPDLKEAILGRAYVWRLADGEQALPESGPIDHWLGVASGELVGLTRSMETGQKLASNVMAPGVWLSNYSPLCEIRERGVEFVAGGATCVLALGRADLMDLCERRPELTTAILAILALNLRFVQLVLQEFQTCTLEQKLLRWVNGAVHFDASTTIDGSMVYRTAISQASLAAAAGVSRQSWNAAMARLEAAGLIRRVKGGLMVLDRERLNAEMERHGLRDTVASIQPEASAVQAAPALPCEPLPIDSLRDDERAAMGRMRWYERLSAPLRDTLLPSLQVLRPRDGDQVGCADRQPPGWLCIVRGSVRLTWAPQPSLDEAPRPPPARTLLAQLQAGATFFEYALIDGGPCGLDAFAEADTTLLLMAPDAFRALLQADAGLRLSAVKWMGYGRHQLSLMKLILALPMPLRLHAWLDLLGRQRGQVDGPWLSISMGLSQPEIAGWLSTTRQYVARAITGLENDGRLLRRRDAYLLRRDALPLAAPNPAPDSPVRVVEDGAEQS